MTGPRRIHQEMWLEVEEWSHESGMDCCNGLLTFSPQRVGSFLVDRG